MFSNPISFREIPKFSHCSKSPQERTAYRSRQYHGSTQVTVGYGFSGSAEYSQSRIKADHRSVTEQSGIYAGDGGFNVRVKEHTGLKGGLITSSEAAEQNGRNRFQTGSLSSEDLHNHSRYEGESFGLGMSGHSQNGWDGNRQDGAESALGYGRDSAARSSVTRSGIGSGNISIGNDPTGEQAKSVYTAIRSETAERNSGRLENTFDKDRVRKELDVQREVSQDFSRNVQQAKAEINKHLDDLKAQLDTGRISREEYDRQTANWQYGQVALNAVSAGLVAPTDSALGIAAATAGPVASYQIGQYFKGLSESGKADGGQKAAHVVAHAVLGAAVAAAGGNDAGIAAVASGGGGCGTGFVEMAVRRERRQQTEIGAEVDGIDHHPSAGSGSRRERC